MIASLNLLFTHPCRKDTADHTVRLWDRDTEKLIRELKGHTGSVHSAAFSPDGEFILSGSDDHTIRLWDRDTGRQIRVFEGHIGSVSSVAFSPDGKSILSGSEDSTLKIWNSETGKLLITLVGFKDKEWVAYTPDNYYDLSPEGDKYVCFRVGDKVYGFEQYAAIYKRPEIIVSILRNWR